MMDNLGSHRGRIVQLIRSAGAKLFFLPKYSPDLNPIEQVFAKSKPTMPISLMGGSFLWSNQQPPVWYTDAVGGRPHHHSGRAKVLASRGPMREPGTRKSVHAAGFRVRVKRRAPE
jgi:DDE superfamily endonuclease